MASFEIAYNLTSKNEGGYANDPQDRGGETYCGISRVFWPKWEGWKLIDEFKKVPSFPRNLHSSDLLRLHEKDFYKQNFWSVISGDKINNQQEANSIYDSAVNMGCKQAVILAQRSLGITETGQVDDATLNALNLVA